MKQATAQSGRVATALGLAGTFAILARMLWVPLDEAVIEDLTHGVALDYLDEYLSAMGVDCGIPLEAIDRYVRGMSRDQLALELNVESTRLFQANFPKVPAPPYESAWSEGSGLLMGEPALAVARFYRETGVDVASDSSDVMPDHIAREFEFMAHLAREEIRAIGSGDRADAAACRKRRKRFESEHLRSWVLTFFGAVHEHARLPFFPAVGDIVATVLERDKR